MRSIGAPELIIVLIIILVLFGVGRVGTLGKELGSAISQFRQGLNEGKEEDSATEEKSNS